ncbi:serine hydrolase domain-containing protein [Nocardia yunnanensis]|nr:serine hydrolase domain-containing protein [Nocardia yunnanensis]
MSAMRRPRGRVLLAGAGVLAAEGRLDLDAPIERYLPNVVRGNGNDGNRITVRQLLQHTSGLPDYLAGSDPATPGSRQLTIDADHLRHVHYEPAELVRIAMEMPPQFDPGARSVYTNTNYILLGMLIQQVTGRSPAAEIVGRILAPLGLHDTYFPDSGYGLGLIRHADACGKEVWGHGGSIPGFGTRTGVAADGTAVVVTVNQLLDDPAAGAAVTKAFDAAFCS